MRNRIRMTDRFLFLRDAERILERMANYFHYKIFVAVYPEQNAENNLEKIKYGHIVIRYGIGEYGKTVEKMKQSIIMDMKNLEKGTDL